MSLLAIFSNNQTNTKADIIADCETKCKHIVKSNDKSRDRADFIQTPSVHFH